MQLLDEVLFIEDPIKRGYYHPRISASQSYIYRSLPDYQRYAFDALYTDFYYYRHNDFWYGEAMKNCLLCYRQPICWYAVKIWE